MPPSILLTAKMRLGYENTDLALANARAIEQAGAEILTVHARTKVQGYTPPAHWHWLKIIREEINIPVVANGDVFDLNSYLQIKEVSRCDWIMLGRGAVMRPDLARQIKQFECGKIIQYAEFNDEIINWIRLFFDLCVQKESHNKYAVARLKQWLGMLKLVYPQAEWLFAKIRTLKDIDQVRTVLQNN